MSPPPAHSPASRLRIRARFVARSLGDVPGLSEEDRWRIATETDDRIARAIMAPHQVAPGRLQAPAQHARKARRVSYVPSVIGLAPVAWIMLLPSFLPTPSGLRLALVTIAVLLAALGLSWFVMRLFAHSAWLPHAWIILRERGVDACLHCGAIGGKTVAEETRCPECGAINPAVAIEPTPCPAPAPDQ